MFRLRGHHGHHGHGGRFRRGLLKYAILQLLADQPRHGYDLMRVIRDKGWRRGGPGSVYPLLGALEEDGLIAGREEGDRRTYEITDAGRATLHAHSAEIVHMFAQDDEEGDGGARSHMRESAERLMQAISQLGHHSTAETFERVRELLDETRKKIYEVLAQE